MPTLMTLPRADAGYMDIGPSERRIRLAFRGTGYHETLVDLSLGEAQQLAYKILEELRKNR